VTQKMVFMSSGYGLMADCCERANEFWFLYRRRIDSGRYWSFFKKRM